MSLRLEHGLTIRQVYKILRAIAPLSPTISETPIQDLPARVQARLVEHQQHRCSCAKRRKNCKKVQQGILNRTLNEIPSRRVPLFRPHEITNYGAYSNGHLSNYEAAEDVELRVIRYALANNLFRDLVRPLIKPEEGVREGAEILAKDADDEELKSMFGHVVSKGNDEDGRPLPQTSFDGSIRNHGCDKKQSKRTDDWIKDLIRREEKSKSPAYSRVEAAMDRLFGVKLESKCC
jgi:hypothetical protein